MPFDKCQNYCPNSKAKKDYPNKQLNMPHCLELYKKDEEIVVNICDTDIIPKKYKISVDYTFKLEEQMELENGYGKIIWFDNNKLYFKNNDKGYYMQSKSSFFV